MSIPADDADIASPTATMTFPPDDPTQSPFDIACGQGSGNRCGGSHQAGTQGLQGDPHDTRNLTLPGEPFAMALTPDESAVAITHQTSNQTSLLLTGLLSDALAGLSDGLSPATSPSMQFILTGVPTGGDGLVAVPHDDSPHSPAPGCEFFSQANRPPTCVRPAFFETNHTTAEIDLLRYFDDYGASVLRPFLEREVAYPLSAVQGGTDTRGIAIDPTPRMQCRQAVSATDPCVSDASSTACAQWIACGTTPSRIFIASRTPPGLIVGQVGGPSASGDGMFDPDRLTISGVVPLAVGPSTVYLAPIVNRRGQFELRVFIVCFDSNQIFVYNPIFAGPANFKDGVEDVINVGAGPFAMAFDPFDMNLVAQNAQVLPDVRQQDSAHLKTYRFAYVALFTNSYLQVIDLDDSLPDVSPRTFENVVFTLGMPTTPKGT
jgi:hypothetical protein